ncbi:hypothetical protein BAE44_0016621 [Dichanthelium oligosanthes]|uniref:Uncharacterized protein n=1 Tax=Dichanthelium oligosanthes TaxID=888268 RepID=A0A1E5VB32_9POAL|nr:hypothetical protein BAE44_0016621 [Dichanthelium oligosanthes]
MEKARRRHVPAFGEWNYYSSSSQEEPPELGYRSGGAAADEYWWCSPEPEACSDVWFRYSPPPRTRQPAPKKVRRPADKLHYGAAGGKGSVVPVVAARVREPAGAGGAAVARAPAKGSRCRVVRPVDEDLYQVPPPDFVSSRRPRQKRAAGRSLWMGCLGGLGCIA